MTRMPAPTFGPLINFSHSGLVTLTRIFGRTTHMPALFLEAGMFFSLRPPAMDSK